MMNHFLSKLIALLFLSNIFCACNENGSTTILSEITDAENKDTIGFSLMVLGNVQDAGFPQLGCMKACCKEHWKKGVQDKMITALGLIDHSNHNYYLFEASPDLKYQTQKIADFMGLEQIALPKAIFLTHGHIGHYSGLMFLGRESINAQQQLVYAMPKMKQYLLENGPWSQLVKLENIVLEELEAEKSITLKKELKITPFLVPHRGEYTETAGYKIEGPNKSVLFIPDIDKWNQWEKDICEEIKKVDFAFLDATFFKNGEVGNRDMSEIPHPFVEESMKLFEKLKAADKKKIHFIHFNHTNPILHEGSNAKDQVLKAGYQIAEEGLILEL